MKPRAYVVQDTDRFDLSPLMQWAEWPPVYVFPPGQVLLRPHTAVKHARRILADIREEDYLVLTGDPVMIGICTVIVFELCGVVNFLRWNRPHERTGITGSYIPIRVDFDELSDEHDAGIDVREET